MTFNPIQDTSSFYFHIENIDDSDQREVSIRWGERTITISSPVLDQTNKDMSHIYGTADTDNLAPLELEEGSTIYLDLTQITQDEKGIRNNEELRTFADQVIKQIGIERGRPPLEAELESWVNDPDITADQKTERQEAQRRILACKMERSTSLNLSNTRLKSLPECIGQLTQLTTLNLSHTRLKPLPESIGQLTQLTTLDLSHTQLESLPESVGQLTQLTTLDLSWSRLKSLPESIGQLTQLTTLNLSRNQQLESLPESIGQLTQLTTLKLNDNKLKSLPESIGQLTQLITLYVVGSRLESLPESIGQLTQLTTLNLFDTPLESLPDSIGQLAQLTTLNLSDTRLKSLPDSIGQLTQLTTLDLSDTPLESLPDKIGQLTQLTTLNLNDNKLESLPESIGQLTQLTTLNIKKNRLEFLPESIGQLIQLEILYIEGNRLKSLPESIGQLTQLTILNLPDSPLESLPESIGQLTQLTTLNLPDSQLKSLPEGIGQLTKLTTLNLKNNRLESLPESIGQLTQLTSLNINDNQLESLPESIGQLTQLTSLKLKNNRLESLPESIGQLTQLGILYVYDNHLRSLPLSVLDLPNTCTVEIEGHAFSNEVLSHLQEATEERGYDDCPTINFDMPPPRNTSNPPPVEVSFQKLFQLADRKINDVSFFEGTEKPYALWFNHLLQTSDFTRGSDKTKKILANIVLNCFEYAAQNPNFFDVFANFSFENFIEFSTESCVDRLTLSLNDLEMFVGLSKMLKEQPPEIETIRLLKNIWAASILGQIASAKVESLPFVDEVEVHLAYLTQCKKGLEKQGIELPFTSNGMMFLSYSGVSPEEITAATETVKAQFKDTRGFVNFLYIENDLKSKACFAIFENMKTSWEKSDDFKKIVERQEAIEDDDKLNGGQLIAAYDAIKEEKRAFYTEKIDAILNT